MNKPISWRIARAVSLTFVLASLGSAAIAQDAPEPTQLDAGTPAADPPGRVARLNYFDGSVTFEPAGGSDWAYAELNRPMTTGDQLWVDNGGRSELHIGSTALRLGSQTAVSIVNLDDQNAQIKLAQGTLESRVRELPAGQNYEVDTPNVALQANGPGIYRVDAAPDGSTTTVTVRDGTMTAYGDTGSVQLGAGQQITFSGTNLQQTANGSAPALDAFDDWAYTRDRAEDNSPSARYVSRDVPGYEDLDQNGSWEQAPDYGAVWVPRVAAGWAPYHQGHWAWVAPWGWTWVDDAPWGFAPFHYGRWAYWHNQWAWVPGPVVATAPPCYSPALVAFVGGDNGGWNVSLAIGATAAAGVAWLALGPGEPWRPAYHYSPGYYNRVNDTHITVVNNTVINNRITYMNRGAPGAVMGMPANQFVRGQDTRRYGQPLAATQVQRATFGAGAPSIAPVRESFGGALRPSNVRPPQAVAQRDVIATRTPPTPFAYRDTLAQHFAKSGGTVPGAGQPVVRTSPPASYLHAAGAANTPARPGAPSPAQAQAHAGGQPGFRVVQAEHRAPTPEAGQPARTPNAMTESARPGQPPTAQPGGARGPSEAQRPEQGSAASRDNGVPRPPSAMQQQGGRPGAEPNGQEPRGQAQQESQRAQQMQAQQEQQRNQQAQAQQEQQRSQQAQAQQEQQRAQQAQAQQEQQRNQQAQAQQEQQRAQQQRAQQEQQRSQQMQAQQEQQRAQQQRAQQEQQRAAAQHQQAEQQQRAAQAQAQQRQQAAEAQRRAQAPQPQREQPHPAPQQGRQEPQGNRGHDDQHG
ncbi:DUF6600 domain-containing protein [Pararobbsia silviterrae]|uniref:FecR protein n=1 Tax=Pararobbsia silviterrae TaxID=1792498 RepID=A0A494Y6Y1_9BURK|nr:DUF6600 domain-containing protein [Pararobbsia silviterrae]RKP58481.1 FecR protein [Pararobbsia silviterrae]